jgi:hypothetical protein
MTLNEFYQLPNASHMTAKQTRVAFVEGDNVPRMGTLHHTEIHPFIGTTVSIRPDVVRIANEVRRIDARCVRVLP